MKPIRFVLALGAFFILAVTAGHGLSLLNGQIVEKETAGVAGVFSQSAWVQELAAALPDDHARDLAFGGYEVAETRWTESGRRPQVAALIEKGLSGKLATWQTARLEAFDGAADLLLDDLAKPFRLDGPDWSVVGVSMVPRGFEDTAFETFTDLAQRPMTATAVVYTLTDGDLGKTSVTLSRFDLSVPLERPDLPAESGGLQLLAGQAELYRYLEPGQAENRQVIVRISPDTFERVRADRSRALSAAGNAFRSQDELPGQQWTVTLAEDAGVTRRTRLVASPDTGMTLEILEILRAASKVGDL